MVEEIEYLIGQTPRMCPFLEPGGAIGPIRTTWIQNEEEMVPKEILGCTKHRLTTSPHYVSIPCLPIIHIHLLSHFTILKITLANIMQIYLYKEYRLFLCSNRRQL